MNTSNEALRTYQALIVVYSARSVLTVLNGETGSLPQIDVNSHSRHAQGIQEALLQSWHVYVLVLGFVSQQEQPDLALCELLDHDVPNHLTLTPIDLLLQRPCFSSVRDEIVSYLCAEQAPRIGHLRWMDEAIARVECEAGQRLASKRDIRQYNAGIGFALLRFSMADHQRYWLKATGDPNTHEYGITVCLSRLTQDSQASDSLPELIAGRPDWNAWLMSGNAEPVSDLPTDLPSARALLRDAVTSLARLQIATLAHVEDLLSCGAFDHRCEETIAFLPDLEEFLLEAMQQQTSSKVPPCPATESESSVEAARRACDRMLQLRLPVTVLHGDLNQHNLLRHHCCQFIDWSETWIGPSLLSFEHLLLLNRVAEPEDRDDLNTELQSLYCNLWSSECDAAAMQSAMPLAEVLAPIATLRGRGNWISSSLRTVPARQAYSRTIARHLDRTLARLHASGEIELCENQRMHRNSRPPSRH